MTIRDHDAATVYYQMNDGTKPRPPALLNAAKAADKAFDALLTECKLRGLSAPGDDRAENVVHAMFRFVVEAAGYDLAMLADVIRQVDDANAAQRCACGNAAEPEADECLGCQMDRSHRAFWGSPHP